MTYRYDIKLKVGAPECPVSESEWDILAGGLTASLPPLLPSIVADAFAEKGIEVTVNEIRDYRASLIGSCIAGECVVRPVVTFVANVDSETDFFTSPALGAMTIMAIGVVAALIIVALGAVFVGIPALERVLSGMTTEEWEVTKYGWVLNPETGEWEWKIIEEESGEKPSPIGITTVIIAGTIAAVIIIGAAIVLPRVLPEKF